MNRSECCGAKVYDDVILGKIKKIIKTKKEG